MDDFLAVLAVSAIADPAERMNTQTELPGHKSNTAHL
jgi:hypothetical protein